MYNQSYEEYMRSVLGYPMERDLYQREMQYYDTQDMYSRNSEDFNRLYPEIYHAVYPTICKTCDMYENREITESLLDEMTNKVMVNVKLSEKFGIQIEENRDESKKKEEERETRQRRPNNLFRDLIRILLLRELLRRRRRRPNRPRPPRPFQPRPYFPGRPQPTIYEELDF